MFLYKKLSPDSNIDPSLIYNTYQEMVHCTGSNSSSQVETKAFCCLLRSGELFRDSAKMNFKIIVKLSWCQSGATRGEGFGKFHIYVLLTQGYPREKMCFSMSDINICYPSYFLYFIVFLFHFFVLYRHVALYP